jgi:hypothetical protein
MSNGNLTVTVPAGWTPPGDAFSDGGVGGTCGSYSGNGVASEMGQVITVSGLTLSAGATCTIDYGINGFNTGDTAPTTSGSDSFTTQEQSSGSSGALTELTAGSPVVTVGDDGTGTMTVSPTHVTSGTSGNTLTFTYTAAASMSDGLLTVAVPTGWSPPSTTATSAGDITSTCGTVSVVSGPSIQISGVNLAAGAMCTIVYGDQGSGGPGATAPSSGGFTPSTFTATQEAASSDNLQLALASSPQVSVTAADGSGTMVVSPTSAIQNSGGNYYAFTYTAPAGGLSNGQVTLLVPTGWPTPSGSGFNTDGIRDTCEGDGNLPTVTTVTGGSLITSNGVSLAGGTTCEIDYGVSGFNSGITAPSDEGPYTFTTQTKTWLGGTQTSIGSSPVITVGSDGTGTLGVAPTHVYAGSTGNTLTFTFTAANAMIAGELTIAVPSGWSAPSTAASAAGATTSTCGTVGVSGRTIVLTGVNLSTGNTCTVTYGVKTGGPGATADSTGGITAETFTGQEESASGGTLTGMGSGSPQVSVTGADGAGTMVVAPQAASTGSTGNYFAFTYTAPTGGLDNGQVTLLVPTGWPTPSNSGFNTDGIRDTCEGDGNLPTVTSVAGGSLITSNGVSLNGGATCEIDYGVSGSNSGITAPSTNGAYTFTTQTRTWSSGTLSSVGSSPVITVASQGTGTMQVAPTTAVAGSTANTLTFSFTAAGAVSNGELTVAVPSGWSAPSTTASAAGATTSTCGTVGVSGRTIQITGVTLASGATCTITYGNRASGPGATADPNGGPTPDTFTSQEMTSSGQTLTTLASGSPTVTLHALDGQGTMTASPTTAVNGSTGNDFDFTYAAPTGGVVNGTLTLLVPTGWTTPSTTASSAGGVNTGCTGGSFTVSSVSGGSLITIPGVSLAGGATCEIHYGLQNFNSGVTAPAASGAYTFSAQEASSSTGTITNLASSPAINVSSDGSGTLALSPLTESAGATGQTLTFTYTSGVSLSNGEVSVAIPSGWSPPSTAGTQPGFTTTDCPSGSVSVSGTTIHVSGITMGASTPCSFSYGDTTSGGPGATVTSTVGAAQFQGQERSGSSGSLTDLASSPQLTVYAPDGSGTLAVDPTFVAPASGGNTFTFTYTAGAGGVNGGQLLIPIPADWSAISTTPQAAGYTTSTCGSVSIDNLAIKVSGVNLNAGDTCTVTYGDRSSGGTGVTVSSSPQSVTITGQEASSASGTAQNLAAPPEIDILSADGSGTISVSPSNAVAGSTGNSLTFTYTAATGGTHNGEIDFAVPPGWSAPSRTATDPGSTTSTCGTVGVSGSTMQVTGMTLAGGATCKVVYGSRVGSGPGATAPAVATTSAFTTQERATAAGILTSLAASPSVSVSVGVSLTWKLTVTVKGKGTVTGNGISCPGSCAQTYRDGTALSLTAKPAAGFTFSGWSGACTGAAGCHFTINGNSALTATFAAIPMCVVPNVRGDALARAETLITAAHCGVGKVTRPAHSAGQQLVVGSTAPGAGTKHPAGTKVAITLVRKRR